MTESYPSNNSEDPYLVDGEPPLSEDARRQREEFGRLDELMTYLWEMQFPEDVDSQELGDDVKSALDESQPNRADDEKLSSDDECIRRIAAGDTEELLTYLGSLYDAREGEPPQEGPHEPPGDNPGN